MRRRWLKMIEAISLSQLASASNGLLAGKNVEFASVAVDTRTLSNGDLYIALKGDNFDGHQFVKQAIENGCSGIVINKYSDISKSELGSTSYVTVENTLEALGVCAQINREFFKGKVVGLTGSSGKTSTKNMLKSILAEKGSTYATHGNFNNEVGVPLTLLNIDSSHEYAVVEMGARKQGDIEYLLGFVQPDVAILLNAGTAHIDVFGNQENIVLTKGEIFTCLKDKGLAVVNADDPAKQIWLDSLSGKQVLTFSLNKCGADIFATDIEVNDLSSTFTLNYKELSQQVFLPMPGVHNIANSLAASAASIHLGFELSTIANGLAKLNGSSGRLMTIPCSENLVVIDDSYNANPSSMKAAIDVLALKQGFNVAVLGEMAELGDFSKKLHLELAKYVSESAVDKVYLIGAFAKEMAKLIGGKACVADTKAAVLDSLSTNEKIFEIDGDAFVTTNVLIKGSRSTAMDELVDMIVKKAAH